MNIIRSIGAAVFGLALAGCVQVPADRGAAATREQVAQRSPLAGAVVPGSRSDAEAAALVERLLAMPVGPDEAVQLALLNSPRLRELYAGLGIAYGDVYDATRLANPSLGYQRLSSSLQDVGAKTTWSVAQRFTELLFFAYHQRVGRARALQAEQRLAHEVLDLEARVREAYHSYAGVQLAARMRTTAVTAARLSAELAQRFHDAGNVSLLRLSREQAAASDALLGAWRLEVAALKARARLLDLLGFTLDDGRLQLRDSLALPLPIGADAPTLIALANRQRLDLAALRTQVGYRDEQRTHARRWRWLGGLALGAEHEREPDGSTREGPEASIDLPVFNSGRGALLRATARAESAAAALAQLELETANEIAVRLAAVEAARQTADEYRTRLLPLREVIVSESQREQNFMLIGAFELIAAKREELETFEQYIGAVQDYWVERARLARAVGGSLPDDANGTDPLVLPMLPESDATAADPHAGHGDAP